MTEQLNNNDSTVYMYLGVSKGQTGHSTLRYDHIRIA